MMRWRLLLLLLRRSGGVVVELWAVDGGMFIKKASNAMKSIAVCIFVSVFRDDEKVRWR